MHPLLQTSATSALLSTTMPTSKYPAVFIFEHPVQKSIQYNEQITKFIVWLSSTYKVLYVYGEYSNQRKKPENLKMKILN